MASEPIRSTTVVTAPKDYTIPGAQQIRPLSVRASFDGSGAAGAWLPAVQILDNNGNVLSTHADPNVSVAAGGSADVTWFPGVKPQVTVAGNAGGTPSVATFYFSTSLGDPAQTIAANSDANIVWQHAALPSDGTITGPTIGNVYITFVGACMTLEMLYTQWDTGTFARAGVLGTNSNIVQADAYAFDNNGAVNIGADGVSPVWGSQIHPNAHTNGELLHAFVTNGDSVARNLDKAFLVIYRWDAAGYAGGIPGWPP